MSQVISITDLRQNLFNLADLVASRGEEIEVEKEGRRIIRIVKIDDDPKERAKRLLALLPKLSGLWKNVPVKKREILEEFLRGKKEEEYFQRVGKW